MVDAGKRYSFWTALIAVLFWGFFGFQFNWYTGVIAVILAGIGGFFLRLGCLALMNKLGTTANERWTRERPNWRESSLYRIAFLFIFLLPILVCAWVPLLLLFWLRPAS
jgi:hypothetical protein